MLRVAMAVNKGAVAGVARVAGAQLQTRHMTETFKKRERALEEQYMRDVDAETKKKFSEMLHAKELASLVAVLPENHNLTSETLHSLLEWKHTDVMA